MFKVNNKDTRAAPLAGWVVKLEHIECNVIFSTLTYCFCLSSYAMQNTRGLIG